MKVHFRLYYANKQYVLRADFFKKNKKIKTPFLLEVSLDVVGGAYTAEPARSFYWCVQSPSDS